MRLAQLACFRFGVESLAAYVMGDGEAFQEDGAPSGAGKTSGEGGDKKGGEQGAGLHAAAAEEEFPLFEAVTLNIYAENALMDGLDCAWGILRGFPLSTVRPHRSKPDLLIDYPYVDALLNTSKYFITSMNGSMELQAQEFFGPLLRKSGLYQTASAWLESPLNHLMGMTAAAKVRLSAPHVNLRVMTGALEKDIAHILELVSHQKDLKDPVFIIAVAQYIAEVCANLAVIYRCSASLTVDEEGKGHREWLLAQSFSAASSARRQRILADLRTTHAAASVLQKSEDLDNYSTHPVELMNVRPQGSSSTQAASS
ncbi:unnamed protein product [Phytomonas sp. EM1]|nr:unnamed protein product [Phytomonas sp. EM1]|eukprot:CCW64531.1 unnamed protein product [Phytomonas sp. isolate EM1]